MTPRQFRFLVLAVSAPILLSAAEDRVVDRVDINRRVVTPGNRHPLARPANDRGPADPAAELTDVTLLLRPAASLEAFLAEQQNPRSPNYHKWLTPEQFADRFGPSPADIDKVTQWLRGEGLQVREVARGRQWITFGGPVGTVGRALGTRFRRYRVGAEDHIANADDPSVPAALAGVIAGFDGLTDFAPRPMHVLAPDRPQYTGSTGSHSIAPDDFATIYNVKPLYDAGIDGTGIGIAVIGQTAIDLSDIQAFRRRFNLPPNDPKVVLTGTDPGKTGDLIEADLDIEWAGAVARNATIYYVYARSVRTALAYAVDQNIAPIMTYSYGACEAGSSPSLRNIAQQANAQGITFIAASGDQGAATCDSFTAYTPQAAKGPTLSYPANVPEVTAVGGTQFNEGADTYWSRSNDANSASAMSYIPETVWNEAESRSDLVAGGGGPSAWFAKPSWQAGPGVPDDKARDVPDISLSAGAMHDPYLVINAGLLRGVGGTSAGSPAFAGVVALLNQALLNQGAIGTPGLGNVNPTLYRLAQTNPEVFHDIVDGDNKVWCVQGSPSCIDGKLGYSAGPGYDLATGLGTIDAAKLVAKWNSAAPSTTTVTVTPAQGDPSTPVTVTAIVVGSGAVPPTGTVTFVSNGVGFATVPLAKTPDGMAATLKTTLGLLAVGGKVAATYSGDMLYGSSTGSAAIDLNMPATGSLVVPFISPNPVPRVGAGWPYTVTLYERAGVATKLTGFTVNGVNNAGNIPGFVVTGSATPANGNIPANGSITTALSGANLTAPLDRTFVFSGQDADGTPWTQQVTVTFTGPLGPSIGPAVTLTSTPTTVQQNPSADPSCQWAHDLVLEEHGGYLVQLRTMTIGATDVSGQIQPLFGTTRLAPYGTLRTTMCWDSTLIAPIAKVYTIGGTAEDGSPVTTSVKVTLEVAAAKPAALSIGPQNVRLTTADNKHDGAATIDVGFSGGTAQWTASVSPSNNATKWLEVSPISGSGDGQIAVRAATAGLSVGVYRASVAFESPGATPDHFVIPVTLVVGASDAKIAGTANAASFAQAFAPGMLLSAYVEGLSAAAQAKSLPLPLALGGVTATVNGVAAPIVGVYPAAGQVNLQVPYEAGGGPAVLAIQNGGKVSDYAFTLATSAPGLFGVWDATGRPATSATPGQVLVAYITGEGDVTPFLPTGGTPASATAASRLPKARQPVAVTVGGTAADIAFNGIAPGLTGVTQINFTVPAGLAPGPQDVVVTVGDAKTQAISLNIVGQ